MSFSPEDLPDATAADADEAPRPSCAEALLAATLALMTGFAEHCATAGPAEGATAPAGSSAVPRLLAAKTVSNLFFLAEHPALSTPLRSMLWRLRGHWQGLEHRSTPRGDPALLTPRSAAPASTLEMPAEPWPGDEPARIWH